MHVSIRGKRADCNFFFDLLHFRLWGTFTQESEEPGMFLIRISGLKFQTFSSCSGTGNQECFQNLGTLTPFPTCWIPVNSILFLRQHFSPYFLWGPGTCRAENCSSVQNNKPCYSMCALQTIITNICFTSRPVRSDKQRKTQISLFIAVILLLAGCLFYSQCICRWWRTSTELTCLKTSCF